MICTINALKDEIELPKEAERKKGPGFTNGHKLFKCVSSLVT